MSDKEEINKLHLEVFEKFEIFMLSEDILCIHYFGDNVIDVDDVRLGLDKGTDLSPGSDTKLIIWADQFVEVTKDAREAAQNEMREIKAEAHVFQSLANRILFNLFVKFRKNSHPLKAFSTMNDAISWIELK